MILKNIAKAVLIALGLGLSTAHAALVFDGGTPDGVSGYYADTKHLYSAASTKISLSTGLSFNGISWWGALSGGGTGNAADAFTLQILDGSSDNPNMILNTPGQVLYSFKLGTGNRLATGNSLQGDPEYAYQSGFEEVSLATGDYFFSLSNAYSGTGLWIWESTSGGPKLGGASYDGVSWGGFVSENLAFQLTQTSSIPEPASLALLGLGLAGLGWNRRKS